MKKIMMICLSLIVAGVALVVLGAATGADETMRATLGGFTSSAAGGETVRDIPVEDFQSLTVSSDSADVVIERGERYGYTLHNIAEGDCEATTRGENGDELYLKIKSGEGVPLFPLARLFGDPRPSVTVTVPDDANLSAVTASVASGTLTVRSVAADDLVASVASGRIGIDTAWTHRAVLSCASGVVDAAHLTADSSASVSVASGRVTATDLFVCDMTAEVVSGSLRLSGQMAGETQIKVGSGNAEMTFSDPIDAYRRSVSLGSGDVYVNGVKNPGNDTNSAAKNSLTASIGSGSLHLNFAE